MSVQLKFSFTTCVGNVAMAPITCTHTQHTHLHTHTHTCTHTLAHTHLHTHTHTHTTYTHTHLHTHTHTRAHNQRPMSSVFNRYHFNCVGLQGKRYGTNYDLIINIIIAEMPTKGNDSFSIMVM